VPFHHYLAFVAFISFSVFKALAHPEDFSPITIFSKDRLRFPAFEALSSYSISEGNRTVCEISFALTIFQLSLSHYSLTFRPFILV